MRDENTNDRKVEKLQNVSHFSYFLDRFILEKACFITIPKQSIQNPWVQEPFIEVSRFVRTHAKAATRPYFKTLHAKAAVAQR